jgi:hypothetical protein
MSTGSRVQGYTSQEKQGLDKALAAAYQNYCGEMKCRLELQGTSEQTSMLRGVNPMPGLLSVAIGDFMKRPTGSRMRDLKSPAAEGEVWPIG